MSTHDAAVLLDLSRLASSAVPVFGFLEEAARILTEGLGLERLRLTVEEPGTRAAVQIERHRSGAPAEPTPAALIDVAAPIEVRGRVYGRLELAGGRGAHQAASLLDTVTHAAEQLARFLELEQIRADQTALAAEARTWNWRHHTEKVVARAAGLLAADRGISPGAAAQWIHGEARRTGRESWFLAERIVRREANRPRPMPARPWAKTA